MNTVDYLDRWLAAGSITAAQHSAISAIVRKQRMSVFVELNALLYFGVLAFAGGLAWTARVYADKWGDAAILVPATAVLAASLFYCFSRVGPYSPGKVEAPNFVFDYVLYLACLVFAAELGYVEYRFGLLRAQWDDYLLGSSILFFAAAYRFDNRFVLSLASATLGGWFGVRISSLGPFGADMLPASALIYGIIVAALGVWLYRAAIKRHFLDTYLHVATNVVLAAANAIRRRVSEERFQDDAEVLRAAALACFYLSLNVYATGGIWTLFGSTLEPWFTWSSYVMTWLVPVFGLQAGIRIRDRRLIDVSLALAIVTLVTNKSYFGLARQPWDPMLLGGLLVGVAIGVRRWLTGSPGDARAGYTAVQLLESESRSIQVAGLASATVHPGPIGESSPAHAEFSGGRSGGAGGGGDF